MSTRNVKTSSAPAATKAKAPSMTQEQKEEAMRKATEYYNKNAAKPGSLASKANMVSDIHHNIHLHGCKYIIQKLKRLIQR